MADVVKDVVAQVKENITDNMNNTSGRIPATPEGMAVAYGSLIIMALLPIFFGSLRSVKHHKERKESGEKPETMTQKDAAMFPLIASCALFGLYIFFKRRDQPSDFTDDSLLLYHFFREDELIDEIIFSKEYINLLLTGYFFILGVFALCHLISPIIIPLVPASIPNIPFHLHFTKGKQEETEDLINYNFTSHDIVCLVLSSIVGAWYLVKKHWIANNLFGIAFAINGVELLYLNKVVTGCILLCGLFVYDIFWVFGTNVMVTVAKSFEAPIKLVFPQDLLEQGVYASNFAMLGLGDIVVPGIFIALLLRFDHSLNRNSRTYFYATFIAYFLGLLATIFVMHVFKHAQPALLYLVPACLGTPLTLALIKGDINTMFSYEDHPSEDEKQETEEVKDDAASATKNVSKSAVKAKKEK